MADKKESRGGRKTPPLSKRQRRGAIRRFSPTRSAILVSQGGVLVVPANHVSANRVGWKAYGLSCLPAEWTPPFFVVDNAVVKHGNERPELQENISECLGQLGLGRSDVFVRSSGTSETIEQRGRLVSETCSGPEVLNTIQRLSEKLSPADADSVHWIVQKCSAPSRTRHKGPCLK